MLPDSQVGQLKIRCGCFSCTYRVSNSAHPPRVAEQSAPNQDRALRKRNQNGEARNRTGDTMIFSHVLYRLSYLAGGSDGSAAANGR
jgi:hypothetical protein